MIRRPPRSTLFPSRRSSDLRCCAPAASESRCECCQDVDRNHCQTGPAHLPSSTPPNPSLSSRSEEHTSELQSLAYLVCRLLLEKKKRYTIILILIRNHTSRS